MTLSARTSEPVRHAPVHPLEQNSGDATIHYSTGGQTFCAEGDTDTSMAATEIFSLGGYSLRNLGDESPRWGTG